MADGSIKFDVKLETDEFKKNLKDMANFSGEALKTLDDAIAGGALSGISSMEAVADSSFANLMKFSEEEKNYLISLSKSAAKTEQERQNEIYKIRRQAAANDLRKMTDEDRIRNEMRERELQQIKNSLDAGVISQQEYYVKLREFRDKYFDVGSKEWEEYTLDILKYCKNRSEELAKIQKKAILNLLSDMGEQVEQSYKEIEKIQKKMESKLKNYGNLYNEHSFTSPSTGNTYSWWTLGDMQKDINVLTDYNNALTETKKMLYDVFPVAGEKASAEELEKNRQYIKDFFALVGDMSVEEGLTFASYLKSLPKNDVKEYLTTWAQKQDLASVISKNLYSDEAMEAYEKNVENMAKDMISTLEENFGELPDNFFDEGVAAAMGFGEGFIKSMDSVFGSIRTKIEEGMSALMPTGASIGAVGNTTVQNSTYYNIYGGQNAKGTALEIYKQDTMKRMLVGESR